MVSPELLRRYPFFGQLDDDQLRAVAMIADEVHGRAGDVIFEADREAAALHLLLEGGVDLHYHGDLRDHPGEVKDFLVGQVNPGEIFGVSALVAPYRNTSSAVAGDAIRYIRIEAAGLRALCELDSRMAASFDRRIAEALLRRLHDTRILLAAAQA